jgi:hypothetical protein
MSSLEQLLIDQQEATGGDLTTAVHGQAANTPASPADDLYVTVPSIDGGAQMFGPCAWSPSTALPAAGDDLLVIFDERETPWAVVLAAPPGGGGGGDLSYVHTQVSAAATWNVVHGLGKYPSVSVVDSGGNELLASVVYVDANTLTVTFGAATSGKVYVN